MGLKKPCACPMLNATVRLVGWLGGWLVDVALLKGHVIWFNKLMFVCVYHVLFFPVVVVLLLEKKEQEKQSNTSKSQSRLIEIYDYEYLHVHTCLFCCILFCISLPHFLIARHLQTVAKCTHTCSKPIHLT